MTGDDEKRRPRGRPLRRLQNGFDKAEGTSLRCGDCPVFDRKRGWCPVKAIMASADTVACVYGTVKINAARVAEKRRRK